MKRPFSAALAVAALGLMSVGVSVRAGDDEEEAKAKKVEKLLKVSGEPRDAVKMIHEQMKQNTTVSPEFVKRFNAAVTEKSFGELIAPIYAKHFSEEELDQLIAFYESPIGRKLAKKRSAIQNEAAEAGRAWGAKLGMKIAAELQGGQPEDDGDDEEKPEPPKKKEPPKKEPEKKKPAEKDEPF